MFGVLNSRKRRCYLIKCVKKSRLGLEKSRNVTFLVSVSFQSRKIILQKSHSCLGLEFSTKPGLGLVSVSKNVVSSNSDRNPLLLATLLLISVFWRASCAASA